MLYPSRYSYVCRTKQGSKTCAYGELVGTTECTTVAQLFEALRYKPERRGFDSRWCHWNFSWPWG